MIRRDAGPDHFLLITQHDHAALSGQLARRIGRPFAAPDPFESTVEGVAHHDCGWPLHDDHPTLNSAGLPLHVFEAPVALATQVWAASVARATNLGDYQGLLVSLHVFNLSAINVMNHAKNPSRPDLFEINKFQHRQIEIQEDLRGRVGVRTDVPLQLGLAAPGASAHDDRLLYNFRLLTLMDRLSLALCCGKNLLPTIEHVPTAPGNPPTMLHLAMPDPATLTIAPWSFDQPELNFEVPARRVSKEPFESVECFQQAYAAAPVEAVTLIFRQNQKPETRNPSQ